MVKASDASAAEVKRVNQQLEERHYEFRSNCNDGDGDASACHSWGEWLAVVDKNYSDAGAWSLYRLIHSSTHHSLHCSENVRAQLFQERIPSLLFQPRTTQTYVHQCIHRHPLTLSIAVAGKGSEQNDPEAFKLFEKSCVGGHAAGCHHVGFMLTQGIGCTKDFAKGLAAFKEACERDDANSCNRVATMYLSPRSNSPIKRDIQQAKTYLEKACDANFAPACHNLAVMYKKGDESIPKDQAKYEEYRAKTETLIEQAGGMSSIKSA
ncbi:Hcp beta-lactamase-like protein [Phytophthora palmivora]|uniref:Hcp beta-lactamase-like protein n=1 Tax=Phytophthora palmivora TaxID=4796 RepID=A0A2P4YCQ1_9STRA|nr:Hcp beta-lactamase-like protein [Phytophthora palmivora]